jgi:hypothetical protein
MRLELSERFTVLKTAARSNSKYMAWYLSDINGREPDFILFCRDTVLSIFEVKDWSLDQIIRIEMPNRCPGGQHLQEQQSRHAGSQAIHRLTWIYRNSRAITDFALQLALV